METERIFGIVFTLALIFVVLLIGLPVSESVLKESNNQTAFCKNIVYESKGFSGTTLYCNDTNKLKEFFCDSSRCYYKKEPEKEAKK